MFASGKKAGDGHQYVNRGDPAAWDFSVGDLTTDGTDRELDFSSVVPAGAVLVDLQIIIKDDTAGKAFTIKPNGNTNNVNAAFAKTAVANIDVGFAAQVLLDSNRKIMYNATSTTWSTIAIGVRGWWI